VLVAGYLLAWALYWPAFGPVTGIQEPLHYNDSYVWPMAWTLHQAAPGVPEPAPMTLYPGNRARQSFRSAADHLAALRVWLAGERGGEVVQFTLSDTASAEVRYVGTVRLDERGEGRYYNLRVPPVARAAGREFQLDLQAIEGTALLRIGYIDPLPGRLYLNEFPSPGDLDLGVYHRGPPGLWTLRLLGQRLLPRAIRTRVRQYKPAAFKGPVFGLLCAALAIGAGALLWALAPVGRRWKPALHTDEPPRGGEAGHAPAGRRVWKPALRQALFALSGLLLGAAIAFRWRPAGMLLLGPKVSLAREPATEPASLVLGQDLAVRDLVARAAFVTRQPEPRQVHARVERLDGVQRACIAVPAPSAVSFGLRVPRDGKLRLGLALPEDATQPMAFQVQAQGHTLLETVLAPNQAGTWNDVVLDLRPYGGASPAGGALAQLTLSVRPADVPPALAAPSEGPPPARALPVAALWAAPQVTSGRNWLLPDPLPDPPEVPLNVRFGGQSGAPDLELLGVDVEAVSGQGTHGALRVTLYWRALRPVHIPYTVFVHLLDSAGETRGQWDSEPLGGTYPTDVWLVEGVDGRRVIRDSYLVPSDGVAPAGAQLAIGLYDVKTRTRLPAFGTDGERLADDRVLVELDDGRQVDASPRPADDTRTVDVG
jgi:hypothetical protein